jgi:hypothetical protein
MPHLKGKVEDLEAALDHFVIVGEAANDDEL